MSKGENNFFSIISKNATITKIKPYLLFQKYRKSIIKMRDSP